MFKIFGMVVMSKKELEERRKNDIIKERYIEEIKKELEFRRKEDELRNAKTGNGPIVLWD